MDLKNLVPILPQGSTQGSSDFDVEFIPDKLISFRYWLSVLQVASENKTRSQMLKMRELEMTTHGYAQYLTSQLIERLQLAWQKPVSRDAKKFFAAQISQRLMSDDG